MTFTFASRSLRLPISNIFGALTLIALVAVPGSGKGETIRIGGCEASDMSVLLAPDGREHWEAPEVRFGQWHFAHVVDLSCNGKFCESSAELRVRRDRVAQEAQVPKVSATLGAEAAVDGLAALPSQGRPTREGWEFQGPSAQEISASLGKRGFLGDDGRRHFVWVDYARLSDAIAIRGRSEIACSLTGEICTLGTTLLAFVDYDEHHRCGYISDEYESSGKEPTPRRFLVSKR